MDASVDVHLYARVEARVEGGGRVGGRVGCRQAGGCVMRGRGRRGRGGATVTPSAAARSLERFLGLAHNNLFLGLGSHHPSRTHTHTPYLPHPRYHLYGIARATGFLSNDPITLRVLSPAPSSAPASAAGGAAEAVREVVAAGGKRFALAPDGVGELSEALPLQV